MIKWFHHLFNPHCPECAAEKECRSCDTLRQLLEAERAEKYKLLALINHKEPVVEQDVNTQDYDIAKHIPWRVRQQQLENKFKESPKSIEELEKELLNVQE